MISLQVNDQSVQYPLEVPLLQLIEDLNLPNKGVAVAVNQTVIPQSAWSDTHLQDQDKILVIKATQGG